MTFLDPTVPIAVARFVARPRATVSAHGWWTRPSP